jgi:phosphate-selective porin OprO/OprP
MVIRFIVAFTVLAVGMVRPASAEPTRQELEERIQRLERIIEERGLDQADRDDPVLPKSEVDALVEEKLRKQKVLAGWQDGFFLQSPGGDFKLKLRGYAQADARFFPIEEGDTGTDTITLRRVRPIFEGTVYEYFDVRIMPDFGGGSTTLQDAYARIDYWPYAQLVAGKFKSPLSLERLQSGSELTFIERSIANNLAPNREVAVALGGTAFGERLSYQLGVFNGSIDGGNNDTDATSDKDFQGRIFAEPFKGSGLTPVAGLGFGVGGTYGTAKRESYNSLAYQTAGRSRFFRVNSSSTLNLFFDGVRHRVAPQGYWYWGPFGAMAEAFWGETDLEQVSTPTGGPTTIVEDTLETKGWMAQASWVLTGEQASYKQVVPINAFDPRSGHWGAFEIAARVSGVDIDDGIFDSGIASRSNATDGALAYTGGINWYLNRSFKIQFNYEHTDFDTRIGFGGRGRAHEDVAITRFQVAY